MANGPSRHHVGFRHSLCRSLRQLLRDERQQSQTIHLVVDEKPGHYQLSNKNFHFGEVVVDPSKLKAPRPNAPFCRFLCWCQAAQYLAV